MALNMTTTPDEQMARIWAADARALAADREDVRNADRIHDEQMARNRAADALALAADREDVRNADLIYQRKKAEHDKCWAPFLANCARVAAATAARG